MSRKSCDKAQFRELPSPAGLNALFFGLPLVTGCFAKQRFLDYDILTREQAAIHTYGYDKFCSVSGAVPFEAPRSRKHPYHAGGCGGIPQSRHALFDWQGLVGDAAPGDEALLSFFAPFSAVQLRPALKLPTVYVVC